MDKYQQKLIDNGIDFELSTRTITDVIRLKTLIINDDGEHLMTESLINMLKDFKSDVGNDYVVDYVNTTNDTYFTSVKNIIKNYLGIYDVQWLLTLDSIELDKINRIISVTFINHPDGKPTPMIDRNMRESLESLIKTNNPTAASLFSDYSVLTYYEYDAKDGRSVQDKIDTYFRFCNGRITHIEYDTYFIINVPGKYLTKCVDNLHQIEKLLGKPVIIKSHKHG